MSHITLPVTAESLRQDYIKWATAEASARSCFVEEPMFQAFCGLDHADLHALFSTLGFSTVFPDSMELYRHLRYCVLDDGETSFVRARYSIPHPMEGRPRLIATEYFCLHGDFRELDASDVLIAASRHSSCEDKRLVSFHAVPFTEELLSVIHQRRLYINAGPTDCGTTRDSITQFKMHTRLSNVYFTRHIKKMMHTDRHRKMNKLGRCFSFHAKADR